MLVGAKHKIDNPEKFWSTAQEEIPKAPEGITIKQSFPSMDMSSAICLWEAPTVEALASWIDGLVGDVSTNEFFEINTENAIGLPG